MEKVNQMAARVEDMETHLDNCQTRFVARCMEDPSKLGDIMPVGFRDESMMDDELTEEGDGRRWDDHGPQWVGQKDGFVSTLTRMTSVLPEGKPVFFGGGPCRKVEIEKVDIRPAGGKDSPDDPKTQMRGRGKLPGWGKQVPTFILTEAF